MHSNQNLLSSERFPNRRPPRPPSCTFGYGVCKVVLFYFIEDCFLYHRLVTFIKNLFALNIALQALGLQYNNSIEVVSKVLIMEINIQKYKLV